MQQFSRRGTTINAAMAGGQVIFLGAAIFFSYYTAIKFSGTQALGLYSVMLSISVIVQIASLGVASGAPRHVATSVGAGRLTQVPAIMALSVALAVAGPLLASGALFAGLYTYWATRTPGAITELGSSLVPWIAIGAGLVPLSATMQGLVDGLGLASQRALSVTAGAIAYLVAAQFAIPRHGVIGLAWAMLFQHTVTIVACAAICARSLPRIRSWEKLSRQSALGQVRFNSRLQVLTLPTMAFDPVTKLLVGHGAGLSYVAMYDIANRLMQQANTVLLSANQTIVPFMAFREAMSALNRRQSFFRILGIMTWLSITTFALAMVVTPMLAEVMFPGMRTTFVLTALILAVAWIANTLAGPGYFMALAMGDVRGVTVANYLTLLVLTTLGAVVSLTGQGRWLSVVVAVSFIINSAMINKYAWTRERGEAGGLSARPIGAHAIVAAILTCILIVGWSHGIASAVIVPLVAMAVLASALITSRGTAMRILLERSAH